MPLQNKIGHQNSQDCFSRSRNGARNFRLAGADIGNCICYGSTPTLARGRSLNFHHAINITQKYSLTDCFVKRNELIPNQPTQRIKIMPLQSKIGYQNSQDGFSRSRNGARNFRLAGADIGNCICYGSTPTLARGRSLNFHHGTLTATK
ncbi:hypothetical protein CDAR_308061 [Caerostris darwini]|uniref:Ribosomal protein L2 n=1 Tax=Caerostris darwini TaxID=1538125 RepID=A0AAV4USE0_9ARAC|nr:hypothetical protein CDAR_308061 [Caerostris darwini]